MIDILMATGLGKTAARIVAIAAPVVIVVSVLAAFYMALDVYGNSRYRAGREAENAAWIEAQNRLLEKARAAKDEADKEDLERQLDYAKAAAVEKEKIDDAIATGASPFDVMFPPERVQ